MSRYEEATYLKSECKKNNRCQTCCIKFRCSSILKFSNRCYGQALSKYEVSELEEMMNKYERNRELELACIKLK